MAQLPSVFDAKNQEKQTEFEPIPVQWVIGECVKSEYKPNSNKTGHYLTCQMKVLAPEKYKGRMVFNLMNLDNPNQTAVEIANKELASMCAACEVEELEDSTELHGIPFGMRLGIKPGDANWPPKNVIKAYKTEAETEELLLDEEDESPFEAD